MYPNFLLELMHKSAIHGAIQNGKHELTIGDGIDFEWDDLTPEATARLNKLYYTANAKESLNEVYYKIAYDQIIFGGYALQIVWSKDRQSIAEIYHTDFSKIRAGKCDENGIVNTYYHSDDWSQIRKKEYAPVEIKSFDINDRQDPVQLIYVKDYFPSQYYYPSPTYVASIPYVLIDNEIGEFHLNNIQNGLSPNFILNIASGIPTEEEQDEFFRNVKAELVGAKGQKVMITFSEGKEGAPEIIPVAISDADKQFLTLNEAVMQQLLTANRLTSPALMGVKTPGQLGTTQELESAFEIYYAQVISKIQKQINKTIDKILTINLIPTNVEVIKPTLISNSLTESIQARVLTINELRDELGYESLPTNGDTLLA
jgi:capsid portal protein